MGVFDPVADWSGFVKQAMAHYIPFTVHWDLTYRCDHKCVHCYLTDRRQDELTYDECVRILDQLRDAGTLSLLFSGGDLFVRPDAIEIIAAARDRDFDVRLNTHGNHIDDALADRLAALGVSKVSISVYSTIAAHHEAVTLIPGSHAKTLAAAKRLIERGVKVAFKNPLMTAKRTSYQPVIQLAEEYGAEPELDAHIIPDDQSDFGLCAIGAHSTDRILAMLKQVATEDRKYPHWSTLPEAPSTARTCGAGTVMGYISPDGFLYPCLNWRDPIGQLRESSFTELWWQSKTVAKQREITRASYLSDCDGCSFHGHCHYCPGISHAEHGQAGRRSEYVCERTHLTMTALEHAHTLGQAGQAVPDPDTPEARQLLQKSTFAERQWAARKSGKSAARDRVSPHLVQIDEPALR
ncbi:MAG: radical SAM protein [Myxococcota bacterium]|nr:radical SAM protein [Myxococcota bacterium]